MRKSWIIFVLIFVATTMVVAGEKPRLGVLRFSNNTSAGALSVVSGGGDNSSGGFGSVVGGGQYNFNGSAFSTIGGGYENFVGDLVFGTIGRYGCRRWYIQSANGE